jgi:hypothetical protein
MIMFSREEVSDKRQKDGREHKKIIYFGEVGRITFIFGAVAFLPVDPVLPDSPIADSGHSGFGY